MLERQPRNVIIANCIVSLVSEMVPGEFAGIEVLQGMYFAIRSTITVIDDEEIRNSLQDSLKGFETLLDRLA